MKLDENLLAGEEFILDVTISRLENFLKKQEKLSARRQMMMRACGRAVSCSL